MQKPIKDNRVTIPKKGRDRKEVLREVKSFGNEDPNYKELKTWSLVYYLGDDHNKFLNEAYHEYFCANGLNPMAFKSLKRFESEVIKMTANLLNGDENVCGVMTAGGTESCLLAVKTYRDMAKQKKPWIRKPEMILPETAHVAWEKAAKYFNVKAVHAPLDSDCKVDVKAVKKLINRKTIMILGSAPEYPHGIIDPIVELGELAQGKNIPLHVDACVGGYILPFIEKMGTELEPWDFRVPGVTSMSADTHKYGYSAKGASTILYRNIDYLKHQFFVYENWPGGIFASPALLGTRPGGGYAAAWAALQAFGEDGYIKLTKDTIEATEKLMEGINAIPELEIIGRPQASLFAYKSNSKELNIFAVADQMEKKGWLIDRLQRPEALHAMVTALHLDIVKDYIKDLNESVEIVRKNPKLAEQGGAAMYGMIANIPMRGMIKKNVLNMFVDMYGPNAKPIDFDNTEMAEGADGEGEDFATKAAMAFLRLKKKFSK